jgi:hypothetical protein
MKFQVVPLQMVDRLDQPKMPPNTDQYDYKPEPIIQLPPIGTTLMMHLFNGCEELPPDSTYFFNLLPKKKDVPIEFFQEQVDGNRGYGLHFVEVMNSSLGITVLFVCAVVTSIIFGVCWSILDRDLQDAWTIAAWVSSLTALAVVTWQAWAVT